MIRARAIKVNINNNVKKKLLPHISSLYTHQFTYQTQVVFNLNLNTTQHYYVNMPHNPPMT
jgi:hypothetical protein